MASFRHTVLANLRRACLLAALALMASCQSMYLRDAGTPPAPLAYRLDEPPFDKT